MEGTPKIARLRMEYTNNDSRESRLRRVRVRLFHDDNEVNNEGSSNGEDDNVANLFHEQVRQDRENAKKRWNFDFENEVPLPGRYHWVKHNGEEDETFDFESQISCNEKDRDSRDERGNEPEEPKEDKKEKE